MKRERQALAFSSTINVEDDERDPDQRLKNFLQKTQRKTQNIKTARLLRFGQFLDQRLWILCRH